jgi:predicted transcriptional regulator of viral defense system
MSAVLELADLAAEQWGLVTTAQARGVGVSAQAVARLTNNSALERITHGVYRISGAPATPLDSLRAAWLALDPARRAGERLRDEVPAVVSHRSAAEIHRLGDLEADEFEFTSRERKQTRRPDTRIHRGQVAPGEWTVVDGLPVTTVIRTVDDLAADRIDGGHLAGVVRDALTRQQVDDQALIAVLRRHAHHYSAPLGDGEALLARLLQESGISEPIERAVALATPGAAGQAIMSRQVAEMLTNFQRAVEPAVRLSEQIANSPGMKAATEAAATMQAIANSPGMRAMAETIERIQSSAGLQEIAGRQAAIADSPAMKAMAEFANSANSPAMRQLAKQYDEVGENSRPARTITGADDFDAPAITTADVVLGEIDKG